MTSDEVLKWANRTASRLKSRARECGLAFNLTAADLVPLWRDHCPVFGFPLVPSSDDHGAWPTVDRMVPALGYTVGNVRIISDLANRSKNSLTPGQLRLIADWMDRECQMCA